MAADIEIKVRLEKNKRGEMHAVPELPPPGVMMKGKTVRYSNDDGLPVTIQFITANAQLGGPSPFGLQTSVTDQEAPTLIQPGYFLCGCTVKKDGQEIGWKPGDIDSPSGGVHDVGPH